MDHANEITEDMSSALSSERITSLPATVDSETLTKLLADFSEGHESIADPEVADWIRGLATNSHVCDLLGPVFSTQLFLLLMSKEPTLRILILSSMISPLGNIHWK